MPNNSKVRYLVGVVLALSLIAAGCNNTSGQNSNPYSSQSQTTPAPQNQPTATPTIPNTPAPVPSPAPNGYYKNVNGNEVPSPYKAPSPPQGASAQCGDGSYSFSQHRSGTCSHHGGVSIWY